MSPAMRMGPGGGCRSAAAAGDLLDAGPVPDDGLVVRSARLCHKCQRSATWTAAGAPSRAPSAWAPELANGHRGTVSNCDEVSVPLQWFCRLGDRTNNV